MAILLGVTLLAIVVLEFTYAAQVHYHLARNTLNLLQASYLARSGINLAGLILEQDAQSSGIDSLGELWASPLPALPVGEGQVVVRIEDATGKLNLNALRYANGTINPTWRAVAERLFIEVGVDPDLLDPLVDWLDANDFPEPRGAEKDFYLRLTPPYKPRNGPLLTLGELSWIKGLDLKTLGRLRQVVSVLPDPYTRININTALPEVLFALLEEGEAVNRILAARQKAPFHGLSELRQNLGPKDRVLASRLQLVDVRSRYFTIEAWATVGGVSQATSTLVQRRSSKIFPVRWQPDALRPMFFQENSNATPFRPGP